MKDRPFVLLFSLLAILYGCSSSPETGDVTLSFRYANLTRDDTKEAGFFFSLDAEYPDLIHDFFFKTGYSITQEDYEKVYAEASKNIPHNEGGYYTLLGFYQSMESPSLSDSFQKGYVCQSDVVFYYSFEGGEALPPSETFR